MTDHNNTRAYGLNEVNHVWFSRLCGISYPAVKNKINTDESSQNKVKKKEVMHKLLLPGTSFYNHIVNVFAF